MLQMKNLWLALALLVGSGSTLFGNGGAWQGGVPGTGTASASNKNQKTDVTIENETLKIDLHPEYADVAVRYHMHNTGPKVQQDFFFPVERWGKNPDAVRTQSVLRLAITKSRWMEKICRRPMSSVIGSTRNALLGRMSIGC